MTKAKTRFSSHLRRFLTATERFVWKEHQPVDQRGPYSAKQLPHAAIDWPRVLEFQPATSPDLFALFTAL